ncbi:MAG: PAS domain S-box protein [bacterium]
MTVRSGPFKIALAYAAFGSVWIVASDWAVERIVPGGASVVLLQTFKGLIYIGVTAGFVYWLARRIGHEQAAARSWETAQHMSEERFRSVVESAPDAIFVQVDGRFAYVNPACVRLLGADAPDELLGRPVLERCPPDIRSSVEARMRLIEADRGPLPLTEERVLTLQGESVPVETYIVPLQYANRQGALIFFRDLTSRKEAELVNQRLLAAIEQSAEAVVITDTEGSVQYVNPAFEEQTGYTRDEALGRNSRILKSGEEDEAFYQEMWQTLLAGRTWQGRMVNRRKDGTLYTEQATISPVRDASGQIVNFVSVERDVTHEHHLESQLLQAQKMESIGRLAGGVAHDFNNMLGVITGYAELALQEAVPDSAVYRMLGQIQQAAERSAELTSQLLAFARRQPATPRVLDLDETISPMLQMLRRLIGESIELEWRPQAGVWPVEIDPVQLVQILTNLVVNARDAIGEVGRITIATANAELDRAYCTEHPGLVPGSYAMLTVSDDGCGMDPDVAERIFEPFFTTKHHAEGTGLGLAVLHGIVRQNDGLIQVYSEPGRGTTFRIYLPRHDGSARAVVEGAQPVVERRGTETVLVVEDEEALLGLITTLLEGLGYTVLSAGSPSRALELVRDHSGAVELLLTDVVLPGMSGTDLWREIQRFQPGLKCLFMSGYTSHVVAQLGGTEDDVHFLQKPFTADSLSSALRETLDG